MNMCVISYRIRNSVYDLYLDTLYHIEWHLYNSYQYTITTTVDPFCIA